ncbi:MULTISPECIES: fructosamine kinase family protein [unclassified Marinobacter]|uniref:fructosamine kinase family protein n=1 Tax=unclassified Marinobacter TaxID=83889 RepID=UPI00192587F8|nr:MULTISPECIES: fructosamine kinase family protein [unclassified Marinobacter]MBL3824145.1 fructosamine kinase family protein [Marinobacter sp. MC3]MBL3892763.1 fructosamine kinase family protein [Marinobacter sp. MW3]
MANTHLKHNSTGYADALICEAEGLERLASALDEAGVTGIRVPNVYRVDETELEITAIRSSGASDRARAVLGEGLARMHGLRQNAYGWGRDNYIGLSPQPNRWSDNWGEFFVQDRLGYQVSRIRDTGQRNRFQKVLDEHGGTLIDWLNAHCEHPSLLHGDLWNGNVLYGTDGPWLIDPAVYCGDREADIAMTQMFGGFGEAFYRAYDEHYPRTPVYGVKREVYNLYHYLNHYNLFGGGYLSGCQSGIAAIEAIGLGKA